MEDMIEKRTTSYTSKLELIGMKQWFPSVLSPPAETPMTLLLEWIVGESVDMINCAASRCSHKPFIPITPAHASEWVCAIITMLQQKCSGTPCDDLQRVLAVHSPRLPRGDDVAKASSGIMTIERAKYTGDIFNLDIRTVLDFAPRSVGTTDLTDTAAELSALKRLIRNNVPYDITNITTSWLSNLVLHYETASMALAKKVTDTAEDNDKASAVSIALRIIGNSDRVARCLQEYDKYITPTWSPGLPFGRKGVWTMFSNALDTSEMAFRENLVTSARRCDFKSNSEEVVELLCSSFSGNGLDEEEEEEEEEKEPPKKKHKATEKKKKNKKDTNSSTSPRFVESLNIPGMSRLIATKWKCDIENVMTVVSAPFRELVLEIKRGAKGGRKVSRSRVSLPTHEYIQIITKALNGNADMFGCNGSDDFDPVHNPDGCLPWVLVIVVTAACISGLSHVLENASEVRRAVEAIKRKDVGNLLIISGERINFPRSFMQTMLSIIKGEKNLKEARQNRRGTGVDKVAPKENDDKYWNDLTNEQKDDFTMECFFWNVRGMMTLSNQISKDMNIPQWICAYVQKIASMISSSNIDVQMIKTAVQTKSIEQACREAEMPNPPPPPLPIPVLSTTVVPITTTTSTTTPLPILTSDFMKICRNESVETFPNTFWKLVLTPPGVSCGIVWILLQSEEFQSKINKDENIKNFLTGLLKIAELSVDFAMEIMSLIQTTEGIARLRTRDQFQNKSLEIAVRNVCNTLGK